MSLGAETAAGRPAPPARGEALIGRLAYRLAETAEERDAVYALRYRAYLSAGLIGPSASRRVIDSYDEAPNAQLFGVHLDGELVSAIRIHVLTREWPVSYPVEIFGDILRPRIARGETFVDPARLCADPEAAKRHPELALLTVRLGYLACEHFDVDTGLAQVREDHAAFYRRVFLNQPISDPRPFPGWDTMKVVLMASDFDVARKRVPARFPVMRSTAAERQALFQRRSGSPRSDVVPSEAATAS